MKAAVFKKYGGPEVVEIAEFPQPIPREKEDLIKTRTTTVNSGDWRIRSLNVPAGFGILVRFFFGISKPRKQILGTELSGKIVEVGNKVSNFQVGDQVLAYSGAQMGAHAEFIALAQDYPIIKKPESLSFEEAASLSFGGTTALDFLKNKGNIQRGDKVLINGASGTVGTAAVQVANFCGAEVTAVCSNRNAELVKSLGADKTIDYTRTDFTTVGETWDIIMDTVGNAPWSRVKPVLSPNGRLLMVVTSLTETLAASFVSERKGKKAIAGTARENVEDLRFLAKLAEQGHFKPVIDCTYPLQQIQDAHARVDSGRKRGSVVVLME